MSRNSVFLSSVDRDLGVAFRFHPGNQASPRVEAKNSALLSSCDGFFLEPNERPRGNKASCGVLREDSGLLSRPCRKRRALSPDDGKISCFFLAAAQRVSLRSSYDGELREPFVLPQGNPVSIQV